MFRTILISSLLFITPITHAENWQMITDGAEGSRLLVDVDSVGIDKYKQDDTGKKMGTRVHAIMGVINNGEESNFRAIIDAEECVVKEAGSLVNLYPDDKRTTYFWSMKGAKLYDAEAQWLCGYLVGVLEKNLKKPKAKGKVVRDPTNEINL